MLRYKSAEFKNILPSILWLAACFALLVLSARPPVDLFIKTTPLFFLVPGLLWLVQLWSYSEIDDRGNLTIVIGHFVRKSIRIKDIKRIYKQGAFRFGSSWVLAIEYEDDGGRTTTTAAGGIFASQDTMRALVQELSRRNPNIKEEFRATP